MAWRISARRSATACSATAARRRSSRCRRPSRARRRGTSPSSSYQSSTRASMLASRTDSTLRPAELERLEVEVQRPGLEEHPVAVGGVGRHPLGVVEVGAVGGVRRIGAHEPLGEVADHPHGLVEDPLAAAGPRVADVAGVDRARARPGAARAATTPRCRPGRGRGGWRWSTRSRRRRARPARRRAPRRAAAAASRPSGSAAAASPTSGSSRNFSRATRRNFGELSTITAPAWVSNMRSFRRSSRMPVPPE